MKECVSLAAFRWQQGMAHAKRVMKGLHVGLKPLECGCQTCSWNRVQSHLYPFEGVSAGTSSTPAGAGPPPVCAGRRVRHQQSSAPPASGPAAAPRPARRLPPVTTKFKLRTSPPPEPNILEGDAAACRHRLTLQNAISAIRWLELQTPHDSARGTSNRGSNA